MAQVGGGVSVRFVDVPSGLWKALLSHDDDLLHECALMASDERGPDLTSPVGFLLTIDELLKTRTRERDDVVRQVAAAEEAGDDLVTVEIVISEDHVDDVIRVQASFEQIDAYGDDGLMLNVATPPGLRALRRWLTDEVVRQARAGAPATPCPHQLLELDGSTSATKPA